MKSGGGGRGEGRGVLLTDHFIAYLPTKYLLNISKQLYRLPRLLLMDSEVKNTQGHPGPTGRVGETLFYPVQRKLHFIVTVN